MHPFQMQRSIAATADAETMADTETPSKLSEQTLRQYRNQTMKDYSIMVEYKQLCEVAPGGVYLSPSFTSLLHYDGVIFVRQGLYRNGIFKFKLELPPNYPQDGAMPKVTFFSKVFHPFVDSKTGVLDLTPKFQEWRAGHDRIASVLMYIKKLFYMKDFAIPSALNREAAELYRRDEKTFLARVEDCVAMSVERRFINPKGAVLRFTETKPQHERVAAHILGGMTVTKTPKGSTESETTERDASGNADDVDDQPQHEINSNQTEEALNGEQELSSGDNQDSTASLI